MEKITVESENMTSLNVEKIGALFPNCITETRGEDGKLKKAINFETLQQMLSEDVIEGDESYEFTWVGKKASIAEANRPIQKTLRPCPEESVNWDTTENLYIEGDNLQVLKLLQKSYLGKIKMIYIDPPYNTGEDFIYNDDFAWSEDDWDIKSGRIDEEGNHLFKNTESNGRFHSDWCSMMYSRLLVAQTLLRDDGVIFISIDDNEVENLRKICDEVFGAVNFIGQITVVGNPRGRDYGGVARMHDYLFVYRKSPKTVINLIEDAENNFEMFDSLGGFELRELRNRNIKFNKENRPNLYYPFYINSNSRDEHGLHEISIEPKEGWIELYPLESQGVNTVWRWGKQKSQENLNINIMAKPMRNGSYMIVEKYREGRMMARSVWWDKDTNTEKGTLLVKELMDRKVFDYPKPVEMLMRTLEMGLYADSGAYVLDFFSGSGTTAHAVMQLNSKDGGNRKFIMVQLPEACDKDSEAYKAGYSNICEIGKERIRRAGKKIKEENPLTTLDLDVGFRVLKLDDWNKKDVEKTPAETSQADLLDFTDNLRDDRSDLDLLFGCLIDSGLELTKPITSEDIEGCTVYSYNEGWLVGCFAENVPDSVIRQIAARKPRKAIFRDSSFADSPAKINVTEIFKMISPDTQLKVI